MPLMDQIKHGLEVTKFKTDQFMRINRVQGEINELKGQLQGLKQQIANTVIDLNRQDISLPPALEDYCQSFDQIEESISLKEKEIVNIQNELPPNSEDNFLANLPQVPCPHCQQKVPESAKFCGHCGKSISLIKGDDS